MAKKLKGEISHNLIAEILKEKGMSQQELADIIGADQSHVSKIMRNERKQISLPMAIRISEALGKPVEEVFISNHKDKIVSK